MRRRVLALWPLLAALALAQSAGTRALVSVDTLPVYSKMSTEQPAVLQLVKGDAVTISLVLFGDDITWCAVARAGQSKRLGYVACEHLEPERGAQAVKPAEPAPATAAPTPAEPPTPPEPRKPAEPIRIREVTALPPAPVRVRELSPQAAADLVASARAAGSIPDPGALAPKAAAPAAPVTPVGEPAETRAVPNDDFLSQVLRRTGIDAELARYLETVNPVSFLDKGRLAYVDADRLRGAARRHLRHTTLVEEVNRRMVSAHNAQRMEALREHLDHPVARKLELAGQDATAPDARQRLVDYARGLRDAPPPEARLEAIHRIHGVMGLTDSEVDLTLSTVRALALAMNPRLPERLRFTTEQLDQALGQVRSHYEAVTRNAAVVFLLFLNRGLTDAEVEETARFWESDTGRWLAGVVSEGIGAARTVVAGHIARTLPPALTPNPAPAPLRSPLTSPDVAALPER